MERTCGSSLVSGRLAKMFDEVVEASLPAERSGDDGGGQSAVAVIGE